MKDAPNRRILLIDDNTAIHEDFKKTLAAENDVSKSFDAAKAAFFGEAPRTTPEAASFEIDSAFQGQEGLEMIRAARAEGRPYALTFVDVRMPPGWDGVETIAKIWGIDEHVQTVICTAFSDYSYDQMIESLGRTDRLLILKKPFDPIEIHQLATALTEKWNMARRARLLVENLERAEREARSYASSLETMNRALETAKAAADKSSELKTEFLVHLSNEVRKNLGGVLSRFELENGLGAEQTDLIETVVDASHRLMTSFDQILDLTMVEAGRLEVRPSDCSPVAIARDVERVHRPRAELKDLAFEVSLDESLPDTIRTDGERVRQILANLVENAIRYTEHGSVELRVTTETTSDWKRPRVRFDVIDTGTGIAPSAQSHLFDPFVGGQAGPAGHGLGLALAKRLTRLLGAELAVESTPGTGSTFSLALDAGARVRS